MPVPIFSPPPVLRFAPSPNGPLHLGHAYSALRNEKVAAEAGGRLFLRIEDLDRGRCTRDYETAILADLDWLGVRFSSPLVRQSERGEIYRGALNSLISRGLAYPCFCSRSGVARLASARDPDGAPVYPGTCRRMSAEERSLRLGRGDPVAWRLDLAGAMAGVCEPLFWMEYGEGDTPVARPARPERWGDLVLRGRDNLASYHLAATVDDALRGVTDVVRGSDLLEATSAHRLLQALLEYPAPRYRHHRLVLDSGGAKLSKSRSSPSLANLRGRGATAAEVRAALGFGDGDSGGIEVRF